MIFNLAKIINVFKCFLFCVKLIVLISVKIDNS